MMAPKEGVSKSSVLYSRILLFTGIFLFLSLYILHPPTHPPTQFHNALPITLYPTHLTASPHTCGWFCHALPHLTPRWVVLSSCLTSHLWVVLSLSTLHPPIKPHPNPPFCLCFLVLPSTGARCSPGTFSRRCLLALLFVFSRTSVAGCRAGTSTLQGARQTSCVYMEAGWSHVHTPPLSSSAYPGPKGPAARPGSRSRPVHQELGENLRTARSDSGGKSGIMRQEIRA